MVYHLNFIFLFCTDMTITIKEEKYKKLLPAKPHLANHEVS